jgi:hypothetical protein
VLDAKKHGYQAEYYEMSYEPLLTAVVVSPKKEGSGPVGRLEKPDSGGPHIRPGNLSINEQLTSKTVEAVYGWPASADFWEHTLRRLQEELPTIGQELGRGGS